MEGVIALLFPFMVVVVLLIVLFLIAEGLLISVQMVWEQLKQ
jgi:hypothetical protein